MSAALALWAKPAHRPACSECQQRKERCDREWPCNKCCRRKVPDWCRYEQLKSSSKNHTQNESRREQSSSKSSRSLRKRKRRVKVKVEENEPDKPEASADDSAGEETSLKAFRYTSSNAIQLSKRSKFYKFQQSQPTGFIATQNDIYRAMEMLPPMHHLENLLRVFTKMINCCYYIIYPPRLMEVYSIWREDARWDRPLDPTVVCLMLRVCACAVLCLRSEVKRSIEADLNIPIQDLADKCSQAAIELSGKIPIGRGGLLHVQQLLLTSYWHSSEGQFFGCWHALGAAIREAQEIGIHRESKADGLSELDLELRRRTWCILECWDWQISTLFSRPRLISRYDCNASPPNLSFEGTPSPILQMKLQLDIIQIANHKFGTTNKSLAAANAKEFTKAIKEWMESFPPIFLIEDPDINMDKGNAWITLHRHYLHVMAYTMILVPLKAYICRAFECKPSQETENLRAAGIDYCLKLRDAHISLFHRTYPYCARFHLAQFSLVHLGLILSAAIIQDEHRTLPKREEVIGAIGNVVELLRHIQEATSRSLKSYRLISGLVRRLPISQDEIHIIRSRHITIKFDRGLPLARRPAQTCADPFATSVHAAAAAKAQSTTSTTLTHCIEGPPTPLSINDNELTPVEQASLKGFPDTVSEAIDSAYPLAPSEQDRPKILIQTSAKPILDVFLERFLDSYGPEMPSAWQPQHWIHSGQPYQIWRVGATMRSSSLLLSDSFTAVSVAQFGRTVGDWSIVAAADKIYYSVLQSLQAAIYHPEESKSDDALWSAILCAVYEGVSRTRQDGFLTHLRGILKLLEFRGAERHISGIAHGLFAELRCFFVFAAITTRSRTFLARPEWKYIPWSTASSPKDLLQHVLDLMVEIPALLSYVDQIKRCAGTATAIEMDRLQQELWTLATEIEHSLYQWKREWADQYPGGQARQLPLPAGDPFPVFQCKDNVTGNIIVHDNMLEFPDPVLAQALCHYYAALILVFSADPRPRDPRLGDIYSLACFICRIMGFFVRTVPSGLASRVAYPFRLAYDCLPDGGMERMYMEEAFRVIAKRRSSEEWQSTLGGLKLPK